MLGLLRPCGPSCLPRNFSAPAQWAGSASRCAVIAAVVTLLVLLMDVRIAYGQRIQLRRDSLQNETVQGEEFFQFDSAVNSRWSNGSGLFKNHSRRSFTRRTLLASQRGEQRRMVSRPRLAEVIKSRDYPGLLERDWQSMTVGHDTAEIFQVYEQLPDRQFVDVPHAIYENLESLPVAVRQSQAGQRLFFYLANATPWRLRVHLQLTEEVSKETVEKIDSLLNTKTKFVSPPSDAKKLTVELAPYDLVGGSADRLGLVESYTFEYLDDVASELRKRVFALQVKLQQAQQAKPLNMLSNPRFLARKSTGGLIDGWEIGQQTPSRFKLLGDPAGKVSASKLTKRVVTSPAVKSQAVTKQTGQAVSNVKPVESYLQVHSVAEETTWVRSHPIKPTETGRLSISVWMRVPGDAKEVPGIRMAIDGRTLDQEYYRFGAVGRGQADSLASVEGRWNIGRVELFDRWYDNSEARSITQLLASADAMLRQPAQFDRCRRLLSERWAVFLDENFSLKPIPKNTPQPVPMFRPKVADKSADKSNEPKQNNDASKAGKSLNR